MHEGQLAMLLSLGLETLMPYLLDFLHVGRSPLGDCVAFA